LVSWQELAAKECSAAEPQPSPNRRPWKWFARTKLSALLWLRRQPRWAYRFICGFDPIQMSSGAATCLKKFEILLGNSTSEA
jgi:hypothetical protein